jgi:hypothetical protein
MKFKGPCIAKYNDHNTFIVENNKYGLYAAEGLDMFIFYFRDVNG